MVSLNYAKISILCLLIVGGFGLPVSGLEQGQSLSNTRGNPSLVLPRQDIPEREAAPPQFSHSRGFYDQPFLLELTSHTPQGQIHYTTDGSQPTATQGTAYTGPIEINTTSIIRAAAIPKNATPSTGVTHTYIFLNDVIHQTKPDVYPAIWDGVRGDYAMDPDIVSHPDYKNSIVDDLKSIPTVSIVMDRDDLFGRHKGIYTHPTQKGITWERSASTEWIYPDGRPSVQVNNGIRIQGGYSRLPDRKKHSFRVLFKRDYGPAKLNHRVFDHSPTDQFDTLVFRGNYNYTWHAQEGGFGSNIGHAEYMRDEFARRTQLELGQPASHGTYVHLYLNGMYWGLYNLCERPDDAFSETYLGAEKEDYDIITGGTRGVSHTQVKGGNKKAWNRMMALVREGNFDQPQNYEAIQQYVDLINLIDYMLVIFYTGNRDAPTVIGGGGRPWNFYTSRLRKPGAGLKTFVWDSEWCLEEPDRNVVEFHRGNDNPALIFQQLRDNPDFLQLVADRAYKHFFHDGAMTPKASIKRYDSLADTIRRAIVGESARWGDAKSSRPKTRDDDWVKEVQRIRNQYLPVRTDIVIQQLRNANLYPFLDAPAFNKNGGEVEPGFDLIMSSTKTSASTVPIIKMESEWKYYQRGEVQNNKWKTAGFDDSEWEAGAALLFVENSSLPAKKNTRLVLGRSAYYFRKQFSVDSSTDLSQATFLLKTVLDDGAVVYINGKECLRIRMADGQVAYRDYANQTVTNAKYEAPYTIPASYFHTGENLIAVEVHQTNANSSDVVFGLELDARYTQKEDVTHIPIYYTVDGTDPRMPGGAIDPNAVLFDSSFTIQNDVTIRARARENGEWSAIHEAEFTTNKYIADSGSIRQHLRISEIMYDPTDGSAFEFIELYNAHETSSIQLGGLAFTKGIQFSFPAEATLPPQSYVVITPSITPREKEAFRQHYQLKPNVTVWGSFSGKLANEGERITLLSLAENEAILSFTYDDKRGWPIAADGCGHSLVPKKEIIEMGNSALLNYGGNWRASFAIGGSPGRMDPKIDRSLSINEFKAFTTYANPLYPEYDSNDWIELYNPTAQPLSLQHYYLSDDADQLNKWAIPDTLIPAHGYLSFDEVNDFHLLLQTGFGLDKDGEEIYLSYLPGIWGEDRVIDGIGFKAQEESQSLGRYQDGESYWYSMPPTRDGENAMAERELVIDEIMYAPAASNASSNAEQFEYIELFNSSGQQVDLGNPTHPYRMDGGIRFHFAPGTILQGKARLILVNFDPDNMVIKNEFLSQYSLVEENMVFAGPYEGKLENRGERVAIEKALGVDEQGIPTSWIVIDEAIYFHDYPWPQDAYQSGMALQRIATQTSGNDPLNWQTKFPTPGAAYDETGVNDWAIY